MLINAWAATTCVFTNNYNKYSRLSCGISLAVTLNVWKSLNSYSILGVKAM